MYRVALRIASAAAVHAAMALPVVALFVVHSLLLALAAVVDSMLLFTPRLSLAQNELRALRESVEQGDRQATQQSHGTRAPNSRPPRHRFGLDGTAAGAVPVPKRRPTQPAPRSTGRRMFAASNARSSELQTGAAFLDALERSQGSVGAGAPPPQQHTPPHHHEQQQQQQQQLDPSGKQ